MKKLSEDFVFPEESKEKLTELAESSDVKLETLIEQYIEIYIGQDLAKNDAFEDDAERHAYVVQKLASEHRKRMEIVECKLTIIGIDGPLPTKAGGKFATIIGCVDNKPPIIQLLLLDELVDKLDGLSTGNIYGTNLSKSGQGNYRVEEATIFQKNGTVPNISKLLTSKLKVPKIMVNDAASFLSEVSDDDYPVKSDLRIIRGNIDFVRKGKSKNKNEWFSYYITDDSVPMEESVDERGNVIPAGLQVFVNKENSGYKQYDMCDFIGYISEREITNNQNEVVRKAVSMNAYIVNPVHVYED